MKRLSFETLSGWPASAETWRYFQEMIEQVQQIAALGGTNYILSGCEDLGNNITSGWVVIAGEILFFEGGLLQEDIIVVQTNTEKEFFGGNLRPYYLDRKAVFGVGNNSVSWASLKRNKPVNGVLQRLERLESIAAPFMPVIDPIDQSIHRGGMVLWKKPAILIPAGWQEVTEWRGRLPLGYDPTVPAFNNVGKTGGSVTHVIQRSHLPHVKIPVTGQRGNSYLNSPTSETTNGSGASNASTKSNGETDYLGSGTAIDHMNPFRIVLFIEYTGF
jgi:hypothetical protein